MSKVCVVDDDGVVLKIISGYLTDAGHDVIGVKDSSRISKTLKAETPDFVVTDLMMTPLDGLEVCKITRRLPKGSDIGVVVVSANQEKRAYWERISREHGADVFLSKPFEADDLIKALEQAKH
ncbi:MAG: response regulator [Magnetovibrionaceae bacterium]